MGKQISSKKLTSNIIISLTVQAISLAVSFVLNLIVPKFIDEYQYAYWQTYVLYVGYVGILHFGLLDGIVLRYSQYDYEELDKARLRSQFKILLFSTCFISIITTSVALFSCTNTTQAIIILVAMGIITKNLFTYNSYTFQITNRINRYAILVIVQRVVYGLIVVILILCKVNVFYWYCLADLFGDIIGSSVAAAMNRGMYFGKSLNIKEAIVELKNNIFSGILLLIANWSAMLLVGSAKMVVQWKWGELIFGKISFAFSVSSLFLTFITAVSVVLFPSLKRMEINMLPAIYKKIRDAVSIFLFFVLIFYFPGCAILEIWLPQYTSSLEYLAILLPIIIFSSKVSLLTNNYLKVYRKEKSMLIVNIISVTIGIIFFILSLIASISSVIAAIIPTYLLIKSPPFLGLYHSIL